MTNDEILSIDRKHIWHPYASMTDPPPVDAAISAKGTKITLANGATLVDGVSSWWCMAHGHNHPAIVEAIKKQTEKLSHIMFAGFTHEPAAMLASEMIKLMPEGLDRIFFADSGSIAVECAAKMALQYQFARGRREKCRLAALKGGYHGDTIGAMSLSDPNGMHTLFNGVMPKHFFAEKPSIPFGGEWDGSEMASMENILSEHHDEIAAVILEPVFQGANAMNFYHPQYLAALRGLCDRYDVLMIFDEIATGFGRTGKLFACEYAGVTPDIMTVGKILSGGAITLAAAVANAKVAETISCTPPGKFMHGPTYMANPLACAAGCASMKLFSQYDWQGNVHRIERELKEQLEEARTLPNVRDVRVLGAVGVIEVDEIPPPEKVRALNLENGVWLRPFDKYIYTMPPFVSSPEDIRKITRAMLSLARA